MKRPLPDTDTVKAAIDTVLKQAAARGRRPTITAVERHLGIPHATFHRHYRDLIISYFHPRVPARAMKATTAEANPREERAVRRLRRENAELRRTVEVYAEVIRQLATENEALRQQPSTIRPLPAHSGSSA